MKALRHHCDCRWVLLYVERWLTAPLRQPDGSFAERQKGTPQGGVVSPVLANLFLHYVFDAWVRREMPGTPFCRYADDGLLHCKSQEQAEYVMRRITTRFRQCGLEIHPDKSSIVYCKVGRHITVASILRSFGNFGGTSIGILSDGCSGNTNDWHGTNNRRKDSLIGMLVSIRICLFTRNLAYFPVV